MMELVVWRLSEIYSFYLCLFKPSQLAIDVDHAVDKAISNDQKMDASSSMYSCKANHTTHNALKMPPMLMALATACKPYSL